MNYRTLLEKIGVCQPPLDTMVRDAATREGVIDRRAFLQICGTAVAGMALDPEKLLWLPSEKTIVFLAPPVIVDEVWRFPTDGFKAGDVVEWDVRQSGHYLESVPSRWPRRWSLDAHFRRVGVVAEDSKSGHTVVRAEPQRPPSRDGFTQIGG